MTDLDAELRNKAQAVIEQRQKLGLAGLVGGLEFVIINTEPAGLKPAVMELLSSTGMECSGAFEDEESLSCVLSTRGSADIVLRSRKRGTNPFARINLHPRTLRMPDTRLETFVFQARDLEKYIAIQKSRGIRFMTDDIVRTDKYIFIQTEPSAYTGNSVGLVQWKGGTREYEHSGCRALNWRLSKPARSYLANIRHIDHIATRLASADRIAAILEFMGLTNYNFDMAIYVETLNSITNVARLSKDDFAMVFTSGISAYVSDDRSGPTERFVHNYGARVHHIAFHTEEIEKTYDLLAQDGMRYLIELVGSPEEGLKQTFTNPFENTMIVNEYIYRYGNFDGFFTKGNVTRLTEASGNVPND